MRYTVRRTMELDAGHRVPYHESGCRHLHGHRYAVTLIAGTPDLVPAESGAPDAAMVLDFGVLKAALQSVVHDECDHRLLLWVSDPLVQAQGFREALSMIGGVVLLPCIPTAEALAEYWGRALADWLHTHEPRVTVLAVEVRETPTCTAIWDATVLEAGVPLDPATWKPYT